MAETVVDMFEPVDVGQREANLVAQPSRFLHLLYEARVEETAMPIAVTINDDRNNVSVLGHDRAA